MQESKGYFPNMNDFVKYVILSNNHLFSIRFEVCSIPCDLQNPTEKSIENQMLEEAKKFWLKTNSAKQN